jgi:hypothetical protein
MTSCLLSVVGRDIQSAECGLGALCGNDDMYDSWLLEKLS